MLPWQGAEQKGQAGNQSIMDFTELSITGCYIVRNSLHTDQRGRFFKPFVASAFLAQGLAIDFREQYYSSSGLNVLRGMHFQLPPHQHAKLVYCVAGKALDVLLDLRIGSSTFGRYCSFELAEEQGQGVYIAPGVAHGFLSLSINTMLVYNVTSEYSSEHDCGISWNSFGFSWGIDNPVLSARDREFQGLAEFDSPFHT
jgi:dTDP-4-dehydrorhamnose 3,5-epimerase